MPTTATADDLEPAIFGRAVLRLLVSRHETTHELASQAKVNHAQLFQLLDMGEAFFRSDDCTFTIDDCRKVRDTLGAKSFRELSAMGDAAYDRSLFDRDLFRLSVLYLLEDSKKSIRDLANVTELDFMKLKQFLSYDRKTDLTFDDFVTMQESFGTSTFRELYSKAETAAQHCTYNEDLFRISTLYLLEKNGLGLGDLERKSGVPYGILHSFTQRHYPLKPADRFAVMKAFHVEKYEGMYALGEDAAQNDFHQETLFRDALDMLLTQKNQQLSDLTKELGLYKQALSPKNKLGILAADKNAVIASSGAKNAKDFYQKMGVIKKQDNGIGAVINSLLTVPAIHAGTIHEPSIEQHK